MAYRKDVDELIIPREFDGMSDNLCKWCGKLLPLGKLRYHNECWITKTKAITHP